MTWTERETDPVRMLRGGGAVVDRTGKESLHVRDYDPRET